MYAQHASNTISNANKPFKTSLKKKCHFWHTQKPDMVVKSVHVSPPLILLRDLSTPSHRKHRPTNPNRIPYTHRPTHAVKHDITAPKKKKFFFQLFFILKDIENPDKVSPKKQKKNFFTLRFFVKKNFFFVIKNFYYNEPNQPISRKSASVDTKIGVFALYINYTH